MSGHNKWSKIKHKKAATDAKRSKEFTKIARLITSESKKVGGDANSASLRSVIEKARAANMPKDNIERAITKGKAGEGGDMESVTYEAYGPGGVAILMDGLTDNRNRTAAEIKHLLTKQNLSLAEPGAASWAFTKNATTWTANTTIPLSDEDNEKLANLVELIEENDDIQEVFVNAE